MADSNDQQTSTSSCNKVINNNVSAKQIGILTQNIFGAPGTSVNTGDIQIDYCPAPVSTFMGRRDELTELKTLLTENKIIALVGMGGLGKTQLSRQYAFENKAAYRYRYWLKSEKPKTLVKSFSNLAKKLRVKSNNEKEKVNDVYKKFENGQALVVFDNVERPEHVYEYLPTRVDLSSEITVHVLITSRWTDWTCDESITSYPLSPLEVPASLELLQRKFSQTNIKVMKDEWEWKKLVHLLGNLPLAIQVAASYLQKRIKHNPDLRKVLADYIEQLNQGADRLLNDPLTEYGNRSVYSSMLLTVEQLERMTDDASKLAVTLINTAAYLNPDSIFKEYLKLLDNSGNSHILDDALVILTDFSLFNQDVDWWWGGDKIYTMHRVIQTSMRHNQTVKKTCDVYYTEALKYTLNDEIFLDSYVLQYADRHVSAVANYCNLYPSSGLLPDLVRYHFPVVEDVFQIMHTDHRLMIKQHNFVKWAIRSEHLPSVELLCRCSLCNNQLFSEKGETLLHKACYYGCTNVATWLLGNGACPSVLDNDGCTPLHLAAEDAHYEIVELILNIDKTSINVKNNKRNPPLYCINYSDNSTSAILSTIRVFIENGADISEVNARNGNILHYAIDNADHKLVSLILKRNKELMNIRDERGQTAAQVIPYKGKNLINEEIDDMNIFLTIRVLLEYGADISDVILLHFAGKCLDSELISELLQRNKELVNKTNDHGQTALHVINYSNTDVDNECILSIIRVLHEYGADITKTDRLGRTVLHYAAIGACAAAALLILELQKDLINTVDEDGRTALHVIPYKFRHDECILSTIRAIVDNGGDITKPDMQGNTVLHLAARAGHVAAVSLILQLKPELINAVNEDGQTALHVIPYAADDEFINDEHILSTIRALVDNGGDITKPDMRGNTVLHLAARAGDDAAVSLILKLKPELINAVNEDGQTALHVIPYDKFILDECILSIIRTLVDNGGDITKPDMRGNTVLHLAARAGDDAAVSLILKLKPELINAVNEDGQTALHVIPYDSEFILDECILSIIRTLVDNGGDITKPDMQGNTVLHLAAHAGDVAAVSLILELKPEVINAVNEDGQTALHVVCKSAFFNHNFKAIAHELIKNGLSLDSRDKTGRTPLDTVQPKCKELLLEVAEEFKEQSLVQLAE